MKDLPAEVAKQGHHESQNASNVEHSKFLCFLGIQISSSHIVGCIAFDMIHALPLPAHCIPRPHRASPRLHNDRSQEKVLGCPSSDEKQSLIYIDQRIPPQLQPELSNPGLILCDSDL